MTPSHCSSGKHRSKTEQGIPCRHQQSGLGSWRVSETPAFPGPKSSHSSLDFSQICFVLRAPTPPAPPGYLCLPPCPLLFQAQQEEGGGRREIAQGSLPESLNPWLLLTRREKRSCLQKRPPGAVEAAAIRAVPWQGCGWVTGQLGMHQAPRRFPEAGTERVLCCSPGPEQLDLEESQESC